MRRVLLLVMVALTGSLLLTTGAVGAAKGGKLGDTCVGVESGAPFGAIFELSRNGSPLPAAAPVSGVLTKWIVRMPAEFPSGTPGQAVRVVHVVGSGEVEVVAKSSLETLHSGKNEFETRLPIQTGDHLALGSNQAGSIACRTLPPENVQANSGGIGFPIPQPGEKAAFEATEAAVPVSGVIEPDTDTDGYGDLTQDGCPQSADFHAACPTIHFAPHYKVSSGAVQVRVKSSVKARIAVSGVLPGLGTSLGTRKMIAAKKFSTFKLEIPPALDSQLRHLDSSKSLRVPLVARVNHVPGNVSTDRLTALLPGRG